MQPLRVSGLILALGLLSACVSRPPLVGKCVGQGYADRTGPALVGLEYGTQATPIPLDSVQFSHWSAERGISVQRLSAARTPSDTVEVSARFISCSGEPLAIRVRTSFLGPDQAPTEAASAWQLVHLQPHLTATYSERSTSTSVSNYLIEIMPE
jgi:hypothetical protein